MVLSPSDYFVISREHKFAKLFIVYVKLNFTRYRHDTDRTQTERGRSRYISLKLIWYTNYNNNHLKISLQNLNK